MDRNTKCTTCGANNDIGAEKCRACGRPLAGGPVRPASKRTPEAGEQRDRSSKPRAQMAPGRKKSKMDETQKKVLKAGAALSGTVLMMAVYMFKYVKDNPLSRYYYILVASATVVIPILQVLIQRRLAAEEYVPTLDKIHDSLERCIYKLLEPGENLIAETYTQEGRGTTLIMRTDRRAVWINATGKPPDNYVARKASAVSLGDVKEVSFNRLTGTMGIIFSPRGKRVFRLPAVLQAKSFAVELESAANSIPTQSLSPSGKQPVHALCLECGNVIGDGSRLCPAHEQQSGV